MSAKFEIPSGGDEEHVYSEPGPATRGGNGAAKGEKSSNSAIKYLIVAVCVHTVVIAGLVGVCTYQLQVPKTDVVGPKDQIQQENATSDRIQMMGRLDAEVSEIKSALATAEETIVQLKETSQKPSVIFHVRDVSPQPTVNSVIKFQKVVENVGGGYSQASGCFAAPARGRYWFSSQICTHTNRYIAPSLIIRGIVASRVYVRDTEHGACGSVTAVATLKVGETVCLKSGPWQGTDPVWSQDKQNSNNFMGVIIN